MEMTYGLVFKTPIFHCHVIYIRYLFDEYNPYMQKMLYVLFWISYAMLVEAAAFKSLLRHIFRLDLYSVDLVHFSYIDFTLYSHEEFSCNFSTVYEAPPSVSAHPSTFFSRILLQCPHSTNPITNFLVLVKIPLRIITITTKGFNI